MTHNPTGMWRGAQVEVGQLSDGYRSMFVLAVDRVLTDVFSMVSLRDPDTSGKLERYEELRLARRRHGLDANESAELRELETELDSRLHGEPDSLQNRELDDDLRLLADALKARQTNAH